MCSAGRSPQSQHDTADTEVRVTYNDSHNAVLVIIMLFHYTLTNKESSNISESTVVLSI